MFQMSRLRAVVAGLALLGALAFVAGEADARVGGGKSFGSRGTRTYSAPPVTRTAPNTAAPIERSVTQLQRPAAGQAAAAQGGLFGRPGLAGGLLAGFLGAGLFGMLFGGGLFAGLGSLSSFIGLLLQVALVVIVGRLLWTWWQRRSANNYATASGPSLREIANPAQAGPQAGMRSSALGGGARAMAADVAIAEADFDAFEKRLGDVQSAYSEESIAKLRPLVTPEMLGYFAEDLADNTSRGVANEISGVKLLQGDLAESWREDNLEFATLAMRYELVDVTRERASGRVVEGSEAPQEITELWTFLRGRGGDWILSAIQQA